MVVPSSKLEFELLKTGMYTVTPEVAWLRQRWGVKRRVKNRERLARAKEREEEYLWFDIPLMVSQDVLMDVRFIFSMLGQWASLLLQWCGR